VRRVPGESVGWMLAALVLLALGARAAGVLREPTTAARIDLDAWRAELATHQTIASAPAVRRNPFAADRRFATVVDVTAPESAETTSPIALELLATAGGPPWVAVIRGIPGTDRPRLLRAGDHIGTVELIAIESGRVAVRVAGRTDSLFVRRTP
jgi:hypothetical protein